LREQKIVVDNESILPYNYYTKTKEQKMIKSIRAYSNSLFAERLPTCENTEEGRRLFRKAVMEGLREGIEEGKISLQSAATHYNHSLCCARLTNPQQIAAAGLEKKDDEESSMYR
jgi:hypothetical protein